MVVATATRDAGVSDADWDELELAKQRHAQKMALLAEEARQEEVARQVAIQAQIARMCPCPMGYSWFQVGGGWRCGGGSHFVMDRQLQEQFTM